MTVQVSNQVEEPEIEVTQFELQFPDNEVAIYRLAPLVGPRP